MIPSHSSSPARRHPDAAGHAADAAAAGGVAAASAAAAAAAPIADMNQMVVFCNDKAGMSTASSVVSKEQVNKVVYDASVGSAHFKHAAARGQKVGERIEKMQRSIHSARHRPAHMLQTARAHTAVKLAEIESRRDLSRNWLHIDMDAFFAAVELRDRPELATKPVAVGGMSMISASNYVARQFGVRSAMPGFIAIKLCPQLIFLTPNFAKYTEVAMQTREIFAEYDPDFEAGSLDEAYLDITDYVRRESRRRRQLSADPAHIAKRVKLTHGDESTPSTSVPAPHDEDDDEPLPSDQSLTPSEIASNCEIAFEVAAEIRARVAARTRLTCSAGIACNRMLAKIATDMRKPNDQYMVPSTAADVLRFMDGLSVRKIPGVGKVMERMLHAMDVETCRQLRETDTAMMAYEVFSPDTATWLLSVSLGIASVSHHTEEESRRKSVSTERTFRPLSSWADLEGKLHEIAESLARYISKHGCGGGRTVTLKLKTVEFELMTRSVTVDRYVATKEELIRHGTALLKEECDRLVAMQAKQFKPAAAASGAHVGTSPHKIIKDEASSATAATAAVSPNPAFRSHAPLLTPTSHAPHARDGVLNLRLMGLRISALKDETDPVPAGHQSILNFVKTGVDASPVDAHAIGPSSPNAHSTDSAAVGAAADLMVRPQEPSDADITSFFAAASRESMTSSDRADHTAAAPLVRRSTPNAPTIDRFFARRLESAFDTATHGKPAAHSMAETKRTYQAAASSPVTPALPPSSASSVHGHAHRHLPAECLSATLADFLDGETADTHTSEDETEPSPPASSLPHSHTVPVASSSSAAVFSCPLCGCELGPAVANADLNRHIDACLARTSGAVGNKLAAATTVKVKSHANVAAQPHARGMQTIDAILRRQPGPSVSGGGAANAPIQLD